MHSSLFTSKCTCPLKPLSTLYVAGGWVLKMYAVPRRILCGILNEEDMSWMNALGSEVEGEVA